jgi:D-3-phosphoglycerate dehydrogenase
VDTIVLCYPIEPRHLKWLQEAAPQAKFINAGQEGIAEAIHQADMFVGHAKVPVDWDRVVAQGRLQLIQSSAAGLDHCLVPSVIQSPITVCSASGLFANQVAEQTMALLLGLLRGLPTFFRQALRKEYVRHSTGDLHGKRIGIIGMGGNGRRLAEILEPFKVSIHATDYYPVHKPSQVEYLGPAADLKQVAGRSDIMILCLPLNEQTHHAIDRTILHAMPRGSLLINVARGQVVHESHLVEALQSGHLAGAGLDVAEVEPLPQSSPLWTMPQVIITPHVGAQAASRVDDSTRLACENLRRFFANKPLFNVVDKHLGFPHPDVLARLPPEATDDFG